MPAIKNDYSKSEVHLFIVWENARVVEDKIIADISKNFKILRTYEVYWTKKKFSENLSRFYGTSLPPNSKKEIHVGTNSFLVVIVEDKKPIYKVHTTSKGDKNVNSNLFLAKSRHRDWTGGGHRVHGTNTVRETDHDLTLLFGKNINDLLKQPAKQKIEKWHEDVVGSDGWGSLKELLYVLNNTIDYVVLRNFEPLPDKYYAKDHGDIDLFVASYTDSCLITNSKPVFKSPTRVYNQVTINNQPVHFDFRCLGDNYYDLKWQEAILENRVYDKKNFYTPAPKDYFYSLLYHALIHKPAIAQDYIERLVKMAASLNIKLEPSSFKSGEAVSVLSEFLISNGYSFTQPSDKSVYFNLGNVEAGKSLGVKLVKKSRTPLRNHLKKNKALFKHYLAKAKRKARGSLHKLKAS